MKKAIYWCVWWLNSSNMKYWYYLSLESMVKIRENCVIGEKKTYKVSSDKIGIKELEVVGPTIGFGGHRRVLRFLAINF